MGAGTAFVTGGGGFVGQHLLAELGDRAVAPARAELDLLDADAVREALAGARPECVFHLAAHASVARSWEQPDGDGSVSGTARMFSAVGYILMMTKKFSPCFSNGV